MLQKGGLGDSDYALVKAGGVLARFEDLMQQKHAGTLLLSPFEVPARAKGFTLLGSAIDVFGHYQGLVGATRRGWAAAHRAELVGFIRGYVAGLDWLYAPSHKDAAIALFRENLPSMSPELAGTSYDILLDGKQGFTRKAAIDMQGVRTVLALAQRVWRAEDTAERSRQVYRPVVLQGRHGQIGQEPRASSFFGTSASSICFARSAAGRALRRAQYCMKAARFSIVPNISPQPICDPT